MLFGMAGGFKSLSHDGSLDPRILNGAWWIAGALAAAWAFIPRRQRSGRLAGVPVRLYMLIPFASIIVHLCGANRVYTMDFYPANVTPVLLGLAVALGAAPILSRSAVAKLQMSLIVLAGIVSLTAPRELSFSFLGMALSPMRLTLLAATAVAIAAFLRHRRWAFACAATLCAATAAMGHTLERVRESLNAIGEFISKVANAMVPTTPMGWGVMAVVASFVLLAVGAVVSLRRGEMREEG